MLSAGTPPVAQPAPCSPSAADSSSLAATPRASLAEGVVAGAALGRLHFLNVHRHVFRGAHRRGARTHPAVVGSLAYGRSIFDDPLFHSKERAFHGIFCVLPAALSRRAR